MSSNTNTIKHNQTQTNRNKATFASSIFWVCVRHDEFRGTNAQRLSKNEWEARILW